VKLTWRKLIVDEMEEHGESMRDIEDATLIGDEDLDVQTSMTPFTIWTHNRVYFPACYDSGEWVESVPRNPCDEKTEPVGG